MKAVTLLEELNMQASIYIASSTNRVVTMRKKPFPGMQYIGTPHKKSHFLSHHPHGFSSDQVTK